ncbi:hypothetical protein B0H19DRAFT_1257451 [Mycena capillaripes]|nr:hypothetical protein B0H19DRAFT_1257451 [Mycena capillaripes]
MGSLISSVSGIDLCAMFQNRLASPGSACRLQRMSVFFSFFMHSSPLRQQEADNNGHSIPRGSRGLQHASKYSVYPSISSVILHDLCLPLLGCSVHHGPALCILHINVCAVLQKKSRGIVAFSGPACDERRPASYILYIGIYAVIEEVESRMFEHLWPCNAVP